MDDGRQTLERSITAGKLSARLLYLDSISRRGSRQPDDLEETVICFEYADDAGDKSDRWVTIHRVDSGPPAKLECYCWLRKMSRTFRADRVSSVSDMNGEVWTGREFFAVFGIDSRAKPKRRSRPRLTRSKREETDELPEWERHMDDSDVLDPATELKVEAEIASMKMGCLIIALTLLVGLIYWII